MEGQCCKPNHAQACERLPYLTEHAFARFMNCDSFLLDRKVHEFLSQVLCFSCHAVTRCTFQIYFKKSNRALQPAFTYSLGLGFGFTRPDA